MTQTAERRRYRRAEAEEVGAELRAALLPACHRIEFGGSFRRGWPLMKDLELVCIPRIEAAETDMFGHALSERDLLTERLDALIAAGVLAKRPNVNGGFTYGPLNKFLVHVQSGLPIDVFSATVDNWGMAMLVRTGPKPFNIQFMNQLKFVGHEGYIYGVRKDGEEVPCPDEETVFRLARLPYVDPQLRDKVPE